MDPSACGPVTQNNEIRRDVTYSATLSAGFRIEWRTFGPAAAQYIQHVPDLESCPAWVLSRLDSQATERWESEAQVVKSHGEADETRLVQGVVTDSVRENILRR